MEEDFFLSLLELSVAHANKSREGFKKLDLSEGQPKILYILEKQDGHLQKDLADLCRIRQSTLTVMLGKMEEKNLVYKEKVLVSGGKRAYSIYLTEHGRDMAEKVKKLMEETDGNCLKGFTEEEIKKFLELLNRASRNLNEVHFE